MMPGVNPRQMQGMMKRMGITQQEIDAELVIIKLTNGSEIRIRKPQVSKVNMMGQKTYQIVGEEQIIEADSTPDISDEDIATVAEQAGVSKEKAKAAIIKNKGDLAQAILQLE